MLPSMSIPSGPSFRISKGIKCESEHVMYVISCLKCGAQGVGECTSPKNRLKEYMDAVESRKSNSKCRIIKHFVDEPHVSSDVNICFIDRLLPRCTIETSFVSFAQKEIRIFADP